MIITIDGPSASGKSSIAKALAEHLGCYYLYTGLLYRAAAYVLLSRAHKSVDDFSKLSLDGLNFISKISYKYVNGKPNVFFGLEDVTKQLSDSKLSQPASIIAINAQVRKVLLEIQRSVAKLYSIIADGRDCGSIVFPDADYKFFLTASLEVRAKRAMNDTLRKNVDATLEDVKKEIEKRDKRDSEREVAPLMIPDDAIIIDNSELTFDETLDEFLSFIGS